MAGVKFEFRAETVKVSSMLSGLADTAKWTKILRSLVSIFGFKDIQEHFSKEEGETGKWAPLSPSYAKWKSKKGKMGGGENLLRFSGRLRQSFAMGLGDQLMVASIINPVEYSGKHDRGEDGMPQRQFMWLSRKAMDYIERGLVEQILGGSFGDFTGRMK